MKSRALTQEEIDSLTPEWRSFLARLAIRCEFCVDEIHHNRTRHGVKQFISELYRFSDEESFITEAEAVDILSLDSENPVPGFRDEAESMLEHLRAEWPLRRALEGISYMEKYVSGS